MNPVLLPDLQVHEFNTSVANTIDIIMRLVLSLYASLIKK